MPCLIIYICAANFIDLLMLNLNANVLNQPFPTYKQHRKQLLVCMVAATTVFLMLYVLEPYNINLLDEKQRLIYAFTYSAITLFTCILLTIISPWLFPHFFHESKWTVLKEVCYIIFILLVISGLNLIAHHIFDSTPLNLKEFIISIVYTLPLAAFPISFSILIKQKWLKDKYRKEAVLWNTMLLEYQSKHKAEKKEGSSIDAIARNIESKTDIITITGTGIGEAVEIEIDHLLFISSADNYITIHYFHEQTINTTLLRNTLKNTEDKTKHINFIIRCHRSYIVNLNKVERIIGDAQGLKLLIKGINEPILVGKSYLPTVKKLLQDINPLT